MHFAVSSTVLGALLGSVLPATAHPAEAAAAAAVAGGGPLGPEYTSANARRYPWPMGSYIRNAAYFASWRESCREAQKANEVPVVDCFYTWERWNLDNHLQWSVRVEPSPAVAWYDLCSGIYDNVKRHCGAAGPDCNAVEPGCWCDKTLRDAAPGGGVVGLEPARFRGFHFFFPTRKWKAGEDNVACVTKAVREALCGRVVNFKKGQCYQKLGSQLHPGDGQQELREPI